jgi:hypothetical protein
MTPLCNYNAPLHNKIFSMHPSASSAVHLETRLTWVCAAAIVANQQVCQRTNIRQPPQDEHIQGAALEQRPAQAAAATIHHYTFS